LAPGGHAFNVAVGRPLTEWPAVRAALAWLRALADMAYAGEADAPVLGAALLAGHCAGDRRDLARLAAIDARWRRQARARIDAARWQRDLADDTALAAAWPHAMQISQQAGDVATADLWMPVIRAALVALGFPGERALDSVGYQVMGARSEERRVGKR